MPRMGQVQQHLTSEQRISKRITESRVILTRTKAKPIFLPNAGRVDTSHIELMRLVTYEFREGLSKLTEYFKRQAKRFRAVQISRETKQSATVSITQHRPRLTGLPSFYTISTYINTHISQAWFPLSLSTFSLRLVCIPSNSLESCAKIRFLWPGRVMPISSVRT
jgi:hypothetical protein